MGLSKACSHAEWKREYDGKLRSFTRGGIVSINILMIMEATFLTVEERNSTQRKGEI